MGKIMAGKTADVPPGKMIKVSVDGKEIMVANVGGDYCAIDDSCTHSGASLSEGKLDGCKVVCGWHGAQFDCKTGKLVKFPAKIRDVAAYNVSIESDDIFLEM
ncbi:MAG: (2Fe-2S)-binding protein [Nitrosopumilales archaeon CG_4_9_14_0_8_um_filter_34_10]|nr:MAG: (2Fe-2S)-binding protein [Nitrosopumilales archaeon CG_4_9_14_0_8_um_filter_34_10]